jgi:hypothetical protein
MSNVPNFPPIPSVVSAQAAAAAQAQAQAPQAAAAARAAPQQQQRIQPPRRGRTMSSGAMNAVSWKEAQPGTTYEGHFVRLENSSFPPFNHGIVLEDPNGQEILLRGTGRLEKFLANNQPKPGQYFVFTLIGKEKITKGRFAGNNINEFDIQIIDELDASAQERFQRLAPFADVVYMQIKAAAVAMHQPQQVPYGQQQQAAAPAQYYQQPMQMQQQYPQQQYQQQQAPAPQYAPHPAPAPQYAPQQYPQQAPQQYPQQAPFNPNDIPF